MKTPLIVPAALLAGFALFAAPAVRAQSVVTIDPNYPPIVPPAGNSGFSHVGNPRPSFLASGVTVVFSTFLDRPLAVTNRVPQGADEIDTFDSNFSATGDVTIPGQGFFPGLASTGAGPVQVVLHNKTGNVTGTFQTEMLSMNLSGSSALGPFMIRESPTLPSLGQTTITDIGGGNFRVSSFFDVFTELSLDGGATWAPDQAGPMHLTLIPEPASASLAVCALGLALRRRRRS